MSTDKFILNENRIPVPVDLLTWARWFETADRRVCRTEHGEGDKKVIVSTVFLGLDHRFGTEGPPLLFETMVFGGPLDQEQDRYSTWDEAEIGHAQMVQRCRNAEVNP